MQLRDFDSDSFLRDHWQKAPALIRNPWTAWENPLAPEELAGLACEEEIEARLVVHADGDWSVEHGPLPEARFDTLGEAPWTLLVQAVDHHVPDVAALIAPFRFVPNWRIDDVMVSYASDGGGVGPHFDQYDVFLIQGLGQRRWQIGQPCDDTSALRPHDELRLLADFETTDEWVLEPGDMLYIPPGIAHDGLAVGDDCMTYSIGFRAPSRSELIAHWVEDRLTDMSDDERYADPDLAAQDNPGEISAAAIDRLHAMVAETLADRDAFARWFGEYSSAPKYSEVSWQPDKPVGAETVRAKIAEGIALLRNPASRFSFVRNDADSLLLFVDGESFECADERISFAEGLSAHDQVILDAKAGKSDDLVALVAELVSRGSVAFDPDAR
ncbi:MAG: JmjC domain-containing protein [Parasphingopyxis sp.]|uniref:JmjC domain-containing protein n=1 Tax=Parasphingopyxis sp. TaxID=1920299 RepID=UPI003FA0179F